jgi:hypothetical protein
VDEAGAAVGLETAADQEREATLTAAERSANEEAADAEEGTVRAQGGEASSHSRAKKFAYSAKQLAPILLAHAFGKKKLTLVWSKSLIETCLGGAGPPITLVRTAMGLAIQRKKDGTTGRLKGIMQMFQHNGHFVKLETATRDDMQRIIKKNAERDYFNDLRKQPQYKGKRYSQLPGFTNEEWGRWMSVPENMGVYSLASVHSNASLFMSLIFVPKEARQVIPNLNKVFALDATFTATKEMYSAYAFTSNGTNSVLGHMLTVRNETKEGWKAFLQGLKEAHTPDVLDERRAVFLMDQFSGLRETFYEVFHNAKPFWCAWHRYDNLAKKNKRVAQAYRAAVQATTKDAVDDILNKLTDSERSIIVLSEQNPTRTAVPLDEQFPAYATENGACLLGRSTTQVRFFFLVVLVFYWFLMLSLTCYFVCDCSMPGLTIAS